MIKIIALICALTVQRSFAGGISGGGGDLIPSEQVGSQALDEMINVARMQLVLYFNYLDENRDRLPTAYENLIGRDDDMLYKVRRQKIYSNNKGPCLDINGVEVDGSIYPVNKTGICISTFNLGKKLNKDNARIQLLGLVAHEYSHLAGANEAQATEVQKDVLNRLSDSSNSGAMRFLNDYARLIRNAQYAIRDMNKLLKSPDTTGLCNQARKLSYEIQDMNVYSYQERFSIVNFDGKTLLYTLVWQMENIIGGTCMLYEDPKDIEFVYRHYNMAFEKSLVITLSELTNYIYQQYEKKQIFGDLKVSKITDKIVLANELQNLDANLHWLEAEYADHAGYVLRDN